MFRIDFDSRGHHISTPTASGLFDAVADYYGVEREALECVETDDGDVMAYVGGPYIGFIRRVK